jgi:hypothetical protein
MAERHHPGAFEQGVMVDVGLGFGALVVYAPEEMQGQEVEVSPKGEDTKRVHADFLRRRTALGRLCAAVFGSLPEGDYRLWHGTGRSPTEVQIVGGEIAEVDWRGQDEGVSNPSSGSPR